MDTETQILLSRDDMERRRFEAAEDLLNGVSQSHVARKFGVSRTTASRWYRSLSTRGVESLRKRRAPGRPCRLSAEQMAGLGPLFAEGAMAFGFPDDRWTTNRLAAAIETRFGIRYDPDHVGRLMHKCGLRQPAPKPEPLYAPYAPSRYSPNTALSRPEISPTVA
jgi:putative transposase